MTPNQLVAYNLRKARERAGLTQEAAAEMLAPYLGTTWSKASFSAAERSITGARVRQFTADEIAALARGFGLPLTWFFLPPDPADGLEVETGDVHAALEAVAGGDDRALSERLGALWKTSSDDPETRRRLSGVVRSKIPGPAQLERIEAQLVEALELVNTMRAMEEERREAQSE